MWLGAGVILAVAALVALAAWLFAGNGAARFASPATAAQRLRALHPDWSDGDGAPLPPVLSENGRVALLAGMDGRVAVVAAMGSGIAVRFLPPTRLARLREAGAQGLEARLDEPAWPAMRLCFEDAAARDAWRRALLPFRA